MEKVEYVGKYPWMREKVGSKAYFDGRLNYIVWELNNSNSLGCPDIMIPFKIEKLDANSVEYAKRYQIAISIFSERLTLLERLVVLIKQNVQPTDVVDGDFLYELWIKKIFDIDWYNSDMQAVSEELKCLIKQITVNPKNNPFVSLEKDNSLKSKIVNFFRK